MLKVVSITGLSLLLIISTFGISYAQDEEGFVRESVISKRDAVVLSALFPGLGQMTAAQTTGQKVKGVSLFLAEAASLVLFINSHENYSTKLTTYDKDLEKYNKIATYGKDGNGRGSYIDARETYNDLKDQCDKLDDLNSIRNTAIVVAAGVWAYNLIDVIFLAPSSSESRRADSEKNRMKVSTTVIDRTPGIMLTKRF